MHHGKGASFHFSAQASSAASTLPASHSSSAPAPLLPGASADLGLPETKNALGPGLPAPSSSMAGSRGGALGSPRVGMQAFDVRHAETFYGDVPAPPPWPTVAGPAYAATPAYDLRNAETFMAEAAPMPAAAPCGACPGQARGPCAPAAAQPLEAASGACTRPPRLQGVARSAAQGVFAPGTAAAGEHLDAVAQAKLRARELQFQVRLELKRLEREAKRLHAGEAKLQRRMRAHAERGNTHEAHLQAKTIVQSRKAVEHLERTKASMRAISLHLTESIAVLSMRSCLEASAHVMQQMSELARIPELEATVQEMRREAASCAQVVGGTQEGLAVDELREVPSSEVQRLLEEMALDRQLEFLAGAPVPPVATAPTGLAPMTRVPQAAVAAAVSAGPLARPPATAPS